MKGKETIKRDTALGGEQRGNRGAATRIKTEVDSFSEFKRRHSETAKKGEKDKKKPKGPPISAQKLQNVTDI